MKALICSVNSKYIHSSLAPWCLKAGIEKYAPCVECEVFETTINESIENVKRELEQKNFDIIGFCTYIWNVEYVDELCKYIKRVKNVKTVLGGPEVSYSIDKYLSKPYVDFIISGEGEEPFARLCRGEDCSNIQGISYKKDGKITSNSECIGGDEILSPYCNEYFESLNGRIAYLETSRGCPFNCAFCLSGRCGSVRFLDIEETKQRIIKLANSGTQTVKLVDRTFNANKKRAKEIFKFIIDNYSSKIPSNVCFHFEIEATLIDEETVSILEKAPLGAMQLEIGIQSFNWQTLKAINRNRNLDVLVKNIKKLISLGNMHVHIDLIAGLPYEDMDSFEDGFNKAYALDANMLQLGFLKVLSGSQMEEMTEKFGIVYSERPPYTVIETPWISKENMRKLSTCEAFFDKIYNSGRFARTCKYVTECLKNPFETFVNFSEYASNNFDHIKSLDELTYAVYTYFSDKNEIDKDKLRDYLVMDRLSTNNTGIIPGFLKINSAKTKKVLQALENDLNFKRKKGVKRAISLLASEKKAVFVDYENYNPVTKQFELYEIDIDNI